MTAAEQLAQAFQRVVDEAVERATQGRSGWLKLGQVAKVMDCHTSYVLRLCLAGKLESSGTGRSRRVQKSVIDAYMASRCQPARPLKFTGKVADAR